MTNFDRLFNSPLLVGGNPNTTSIYALIHYLERAHGIHFAMGGTGAIVSALEGLLKRQGVDILTGHSVKQFAIKIARLRCRVRVGQTMDADLVVFNGDPMPVPAYVAGTKLPLSQAETPIKLSMGLYVLFFGTVLSTRCRLYNLVR